MENRKNSQKCWVYGQQKDSKLEGRYEVSFKNNGVFYDTQVVIAERCYCFYKADFGFWAYDLPTQKIVYVLFEPKGYVDFSDKKKFEKCFFNNYTNILINGLYLKNRYFDDTQNIIEIFNQAKENSFKPFPVCNDFHEGLFPWRLDAIQRKEFRFLITNGEIYVLVGENFDFYNKNFKEFIIPTNEFYSQNMDAKFDKNNILIENLIQNGIFTRRRWRENRIEMYLGGLSPEKREKQKQKIINEIYKAPESARAFWHEIWEQTISYIETGRAYNATN